MDLQLLRLPLPGESVGVYRVLAQVARGGQGHVFQAECQGRLFVLKFFRASPLAPRGEREIDILRWLEHPNVVRVLGYGRWPDPERGSLYIAMEWVDGPTLDAHARGMSARQATGLLLKVARAFGELHRRGVLHRDIKPENVLVRRGTGEPVVVDFGVGHLDGFSSVEGRQALVGTPEFHSPEAWQFAWEHFGASVRYQAGVTDEVWALGITFYQVFTDSLPFGSRATNLEMVTDVRTRSPPPPHERNARVPVALSQACMRLLERDLQKRCADMDAVAAVLEAALVEAEGDAAWDVPLLEPEVRPEEEREVAPGPPAHPVEPEPFAMQPRLRPIVFPGQPAALPETVETRVPSPSVLTRGRWREQVSRWLPTWVGVFPLRATALDALRRGVLGLGAVGVLLVGVWLLSARPHGVTSGTTPEVMGSPRLTRSSPMNPAPKATTVHGMAGAGEMSQVEGMTLPFMPPVPPSPFASAMLREEDPRGKSETKPSEPISSKTRASAPLRKMLGVAGVCTAALSGCSPTSQVVRVSDPPAYPPAEECPAGSRETAKEMGYTDRDFAAVSLQGVQGIARDISVREGPAVARLKDALGKLPAGTLLQGRFLISEKLLHGRFTQALTTEGKTYPVCIELTAHEDWTGVGFFERKGDVVVCLSTQGVMPTYHFGK